MNKKVSLILSIILIVLGAINSGIFLIFGLFGSFVCSKPFYIINGSNDSIPTCTSIFNTEFVFSLSFGICLIFIGVILIVLRRKKL